MSQPNYPQPYGDEFRALMQKLDAALGRATSAEFQRDRYHKTLAVLGEVLETARSYVDASNDGWLNKERFDGHEFYRLRAAVDAAEQKLRAVGGDPE